MELPVKYKSQHDPDAGLARGDCMETCLAMILSYLYDTEISTWPITKITGGSSRITTYPELNYASESLGVHLENKHGQGRIEDSEALLKEGKPHIAIIDYSKADMWREDFDYNGFHAVLIIGTLINTEPGQEKQYIFNDPDFCTLDKKHKQIIRSNTFEEAWAATGYQMIIPTRGRK